jgi:hypothetical protein
MLCENLNLKIIKLDFYENLALNSSLFAFSLCSRRIRGMSSYQVMIRKMVPAPTHMPIIKMLWAFALNQSSIQAPYSLLIDFLVDF